MVDAIPDPESSREHLQAWKGKIDRLAADTRAMSARFQELRVTLADPDRLCQVTVDSTGNLVDLYLSEKSRRVDTELTSQAVLDTIRAAKAQIADQSAQIITETLGPDSPAGQAIAERVRNQLMPRDDEEGEV